MNLATKSVRSEDERTSTVKPIINPGMTIKLISCYENNRQDIQNVTIFLEL